ncbi:MAG: hypothetical protein PVI78_12775 [Anaerolineales bacterium]
MKPTSLPPARKCKRIRWGARILGLIFVGLWLLISLMMVVVEGIGEGVEDRIMVVLILSSTIAFAVAWWYEGIGGMLLVIVGIAHSMFAFFSAGHNVGLAMLISGGPFLLAGALFLIAWSCSRKTTHESP